MHRELSQLLKTIVNVAATAFGIWVPFWAIRRHYELDEHLTGTEIAMRWIVVAVCFAIGGSLTSFNDTFVRNVLLSIGLVFLCWPNTAYHVAQFFRRLTGRERQVVENNT